MINFAHLHLVLNHLPIMTIPIALVFFVFSICRKNEELKKFSLLVIAATAATVIPVFFTGEPAEDVVEGLVGISKKLIHDHEETAELSLILTLIAGAFSIIMLFFEQKFVFLKKYGDKVVLALCVAALGLLVYTANKGGKIRHSELRDGASVTDSTNLKTDGHDH